MVFPILFGIEFNFFIVLPMGLKICKSNVYSLSQGKTCAPEKLGTAQNFREPRPARLVSDTQFVQT